MKQLQFILLTLLIFFLAAEGLVRWMVGTPWPERLPLLEVEADLELGFRMVAGHFHYTYQEPVQLNTLGFRGPEVPLVKAAGEYRLLVLGDSHVYGQGVADGQLMTSVLETTLQRSGWGRVRVVNLGVRAYGLSQEVALLGRLGGRLRGDGVLLFVYLNDFEWVDIRARYERYRRDGRYIFDFSGKETDSLLWRWHGVQFLRRSGLVMWLHDLLAQVRYRDGLENRLLRGEVGEVGWVVRELEKLVMLGRELAVPVTVVPIPAAVQLRVAFPRERYQSFLRESAAGLGLGYFDPLPDMARAYREGGEWPVIPYDGHYDGVGQRWLGEAVGGYLRREWNGQKGQKGQTAKP